MAIHLGLDLGSNSLGWSLIDKDKAQILGMGVRIFPEGLKIEKGNEESKNAVRRKARQMRRQYFRRKLRKKHLLKVLIDKGMTPITYEDLQTWLKTGFYPQRKAIQEWFRDNPYLLRNEALERELTKYEMGRVLYHLAIRRGYKESLQTELKKDSTLKEGKNGFIGITATESHMKNQTLGQYFATLVRREGEAYTFKERIRKRYSLRKMYIDEFERIWDFQQKFNPTFYTEAFREQIGGVKGQKQYKKDGILFFQRPLRSQKHTIGRCSFEKGKFRTPLSNPVFQEYRIWQQLNNLAYDGNPISQEQKELLADLFMRHKEIKMKTIRTFLKLHKEINKFNYEDDFKFKGNSVSAALSDPKIFGEQWFSFTEKEQFDIWHILFSTTDSEWLAEYAAKKWKLTSKQIDALLNVRLEKGYASISHKAAALILPFLKMGYKYHQAVLLAGIKRVLKNDFDAFWDENADTLESILATEASHTIERIKDLLKHTNGLNDKQLSKLYHHSRSLEEVELQPRIPIDEEVDRMINKVRNPLVRQALFEVRTVVNSIIDEYGRPDVILLEMPRDMSKSIKQRQDIRKKQKELERENDRARKFLEENNINPSRTNIIKYRLWEECKHTCPYTGASICKTDLFVNGRFDIEHIVPWSVSLDDSYGNLTLCEKIENINKGNKTPYQFYGNDPQKWAEFKQRAKELFANPRSYSKYRKLISQEEPDVDKMIARQLNDTRYASVEAVGLLKLICKDVRFNPGMMTSKLRHYWGLNSILSEDDSKNRMDHRHHAIDATVIASIERSHLQKLSKIDRYYKRGQDVNEMEKQIALPWPSFRSDVERAVNQILVSHKRLDKTVTERYITIERNGKEYRQFTQAARGSLHKETVYGKRRLPQSDEFGYHVRKPLSEIIDSTHISKVVDPVIRELMIKRCAELGVNITAPKWKVPKDAFFENIDGKTVPNLFLPNRNGEPVPITKVRIRESSSTAVQIAPFNAYVEPGSNHHILIYKDRKGKLQEEVVTFWTAVQRRKQNQQVVQLPTDGIEIVTVLQINKMYLLGLHDDQINWDNPDKALLTKHLYRVQKLSSKDYVFRLNTEATIRRDSPPYLKRIVSFRKFEAENPIEVIILPNNSIKKA